MSLCRQIEADLYCQDIPEDGRCGILNGTANWHYQLPSLEILSQRVTTLRFFPRCIGFFFKLSLREDSCFILKIK